MATVGDNGNRPELRMKDKLKKNNKNFLTDLSRLGGDQNIKTTPLLVERRKQLKPFVLQPVTASLTYKKYSTMVRIVQVLLTITDLKLRALF